MYPRTDQKALYKIRRFRKGRGLQRFLTQKQVAYYREKYPHWRIEQLTHHAPARQGSVYGSRPDPAYSNSRRGAGFSSTWGFNPLELRESARRTGNKVISYDDILDVLLSLPTYSEKKGI